MEITKHPSNLNCLFVGVSEGWNKWQTYSPNGFHTWRAHAALAINRSGLISKNISRWPSQINRNRRMLIRASACSKLNWDKKRLIRYVEQMGRPWFAIFAEVSGSRRTQQSIAEGLGHFYTWNLNKAPFHQNQVLEKCSVVSHHLATKHIHVLKSLFGIECSSIRCFYPCNGAVQLDGLLSHRSETGPNSNFKIRIDLD